MPRLSAGSFKKGSHLQALPRDGTKIRKIYDWFLTNPLTPISYSELVKRGWCHPRGRSWSAIRDQLEEYGLFVNAHKRGWWWLTSTDVRDYLGEALDKGLDNTQKRWYGAPVR